MVDTQEHNVKTLGEMIRVGREERSFTQRELADRLNLSHKVIEHLESENHEELPAPTFVKGYIRSIAQHLKLDPEPLLQAYQPSEAAVSELASTVTAAQQRKSSDPMMVWVSAGLVGVVLLMLLIWGVSSWHSSADDVNVADSNSASEFMDEPLDNIALPELAVQSGQTGDSTLSVSIDANGQVVPSLSAGSTQLLVPSNAVNVNNLSNNPSLPIVAPELKLVVNGKTWVEVTDANGEKIIFTMMDASDGEQVIEGKAPYKIFLGDARQVDIYRKGEKIDHQVYMRRNRTARFNVK